MSKANTAVYLMISVIVLITIVFLVSDRAKKQNKKQITKQWKKGANCFIYRQSKEIILEPNSKI